MFNAHFPEGLYNTTNRSFTSSVTESDYRTRTVSAVGTVTAPLYFLRLLGQSTTVLAARATASRRDVNPILVLDRSGSIAQAGATAAVKNSSIAFVEKFADGNTGYAEALWQAYEQLRIINEPGALNVIVFFTDGRPTALTASFPVKTVSDRRYGDGSYPYSSTSSLYTMPASSCKSSAAKLGFFSAQGPNYGYTLETQIQGVTWGVMDPDATTSQDEWTLAADSSGCAYAAGSGSSYRRRARRDIAYIPDSDTHGNSTWGYKSFTANQDLFPNGHPYAGKIRPDSVRAVRYAAYNLADNIAQRCTARPGLLARGLGNTAHGRMTSG